MDNLIEKKQVKINFELLTKKELIHLLQMIYFLRKKTIFDALNETQYSNTDCKHCKTIDKKDLYL